MSTASHVKEIDSLMESASRALVHTRYFEAERLAEEALAAARSSGDFDRMSRILLPLQEARRQRVQQALDVGAVTLVTAPITEEMPIERGCYLIQPPQVGADARRLRLMALEREIPVAVLCREPKTKLGLCPVVAISPGMTMRTCVDPPQDWDNPDLPWFAQAMELLGEHAIESIDPALAVLKRLDALLLRLDALPEHESLHQALEQTCREALREQMAESAPRKSAERDGGCAPE